MNSIALLSGKVVDEGFEFHLSQHLEGLFRLKTISSVTTAAAPCVQLTWNFSSPLKILSDELPGLKRRDLFELLESEMTAESFKHSQSLLETPEFHITKSRRGDVYEITLPPRFMFLSSSTTLFDWLGFTKIETDFAEFFGFTYYFYDDNFNIVQPTDTGAKGWYGFFNETDEPKKLSSTSPLASDTPLPAGELLSAAFGRTRVCGTNVTGNFPSFNVSPVAVATGMQAEFREAVRRVNLPEGSLSLGTTGKRLTVNKNTANCLVTAKLNRHAKYLLRFSREEALLLCDSETGPEDKVTSSEFAYHEHDMRFVEDCYLQCTASVVCEPGELLYLGKGKSDLIGVLSKGKVRGLTGGGGQCVLLNGEATPVIRIRGIDCGGNARPDLPVAGQDCWAMLEKCSATNLRM